MAWYDAIVSQAHAVNGEQGIDLATSFRTPLTALDPGKVDAASYGPWGGLVGERTARGEEYYLHLDQINVSQGQNVASGDVIGLSGGQNVGGAHPAAPAYSSGPHTEYGIFSGPLFASVPLDPTPVIAAARTGQLGVGGLGLPGLPDPTAMLNGLGQGLANALAAGLVDVATFFKRQIIALAVAVVVAIVLFA